MSLSEKDKTALKVNKGIPQPDVVNANFLKKMKSRQPELQNVEYYLSGIFNCDIKILAQAITLIESVKPAHREMAEQLLEACIPKAKKSIRIGITGVPGVGKSTFIEAFGTYLTKQGHKVAVLAIDPSSSRNKGSILGDKTRMEDLSNNPNAFIRPSPSSGSLGGVAQKTRETISICEAAGYDVILVETVGVGQSETAVHSMVDFFLLLMLAGAGDELQGIKRGIIEMCDAIFINKADGDNLQKAKMSRVQYANALHLFPASESGWTPVSDICSATENTGIDRIWDYVQQYMELTRENAYFDFKRQQQELFRMHEQINYKLKSLFYENESLKMALDKSENEIKNNTKSAYQLADDLIARYKELLRS